MKKFFVFLSLFATTIILSIVALTVSLFDRKGEVVHRIGRFWATLHLKTCGIRVILNGVDNIARPPYIFMCNHQSELDIYGLLSMLPLSFKWVAKRQLFYIPFLGWAMKRAGYISLDRESPREALKAINEAAQKIKDGMSIIIFPEGTRSPDGTLLPFKKGVFSLPVRAGIPIVPVGINGTRRLQPKGSFLPVEKGVIYINIGEPIPTTSTNRSAKTDIMLTVRAAIERQMGCQAN